MRFVELCDAFVRISVGVWRWMKRARAVRNPSLTKSAIRTEATYPMQLKETTLTDYVVLRLLEECSEFVKVFTFTQQLETELGADMEVWFTDSARKWLGLRVQCKVLGPRDTFEELHYQTKSGDFQSDILIQSTKSGGVKGCLPVYLLYVGPNSADLLLWHWRCPCWLPWSYHWWYQPFGNWWISAYKVKALRPQKHLNELWSYMWPWQCIVCCPKWAHDRVEKILYVLRETVFFNDSEAMYVEAVDTPPMYVQLALEGRLPDAVNELRRLLDGREMRHLVIVEVGQTTEE